MVKGEHYKAVERENHKAICWLPLHTRPIPGYDVCDEGAEEGHTCAGCAPSRFACFGLPARRAVRQRAGRVLLGQWA